MTALVALVALALAFDVLNGFHDSANSIATVVSTRVLTLRHARREQHRQGDRPPRAHAGAIVGVASARRARRVHWRPAEKIGWAWLATIPGAALISACAWMGLKLAGVGS